MDISEIKIDDEFIRLIIDNPHYLGWLIGKEKLNPLHSEWIKYCWDADEPRALMSFRGGYKSTSIDLVGAIRSFILHPNDRIALIRKSFKDASTIVDSVKKAMQIPIIKEIFKYVNGVYPRARTAKEGKLEYDFKKSITPEANLTAFGIDGSLTGFHFDRIVCDDIITLKDRISKAEREHTKEVVRELATNIIDPDKGSIWIGTPWHKDDAWNEINSFTDIAMYPISKYNFLGKKAVEEKKRKTTPFLFMANYELEIKRDETSLFSEPKMAEGWDYSKKSYAHIDCAYDGNHYCALTILSPLDDDNPTLATKFQGVGFTYPGNCKAWAHEVASLFRRYKCKFILNETNPDKGYFANQMEKLGVRMKTYSESENKYIKISTNLYEYWENIYWSPNTDSEYLNQCVDFREGSEPDDAPDSCASLLREICKPNKSRSKALWTM